ncbi:1-aminocyclopropane-1-carboxylate oxidase homolog 12-like [Syzygium oleosum]|uniref:1-aminocyclopropane-1-carboxylate oxidase homolog 12-like n=1 Tax=Syzygium oleosum TaxID=219896 RepID=UPI0024B94D27|nr:1-aminocyclopropane-1-carboxylate oxidase homolog 12-like [Syzygium oleosum]
MLMKYSKHVMRQGSRLLELLSEALGLHPNHLKEMECGKGHAIVCHYYPPCPQPELTLSVTKHSDDFLTIRLQDQIGGLKVLHENQWIDVPPIPGALVINIGDLLQNLYIRPDKTSEGSSESSGGSENLSFPIIDLGGIDRDPAKRKEAIERMRRASETLGSFQVVANQGVPAAVMEEIEGGFSHARQNKEQLLSF